MFSSLQNALVNMCDFAGSSAVRLPAHVAYDSFVCPLHSQIVLLSIACPSGSAEKLLKEPSILAMRYFFLYMS